MNKQDYCRGASLIDNPADCEKAANELKFTWVVDTVRGHNYHHNEDVGKIPGLTAWRQGCYQSWKLGPIGDKAVQFNIDKNVKADPQSTGICKCSTLTKSKPAPPSPTSPPTTTNSPLSIGTKFPTCNAPSCANRDGSCACASGAGKLVTISKDDSQGVPSKKIPEKAGPNKGGVGPGFFLNVPKPNLAW